MTGETASAGIQNAMDIRIIKTDEQYRKALEEVGRLAGKDPVPESTDGARLELLAKLVEDYEKDRFLFKKPDPIDAIVFRMDREGSASERHCRPIGRPQPRIRSTFQKAPSHAANDPGAI